MKEMILSIFVILQCSNGWTQSRPLAYFHVRPGAEAQFNTLAQQVMGLSRQEPGCRISILNLSKIDLQLYAIYELCRSENDSQRHRTTLYVQSFLKSVRPMLNAECGLPCPYNPQDPDNRAGTCHVTPCPPCPYNPQDPDNRAGTCHP